MTTTDTLASTLPTATKANAKANAKAPATLPEGAVTLSTLGGTIRHLAVVSNAKAKGTMATAQKAVEKANATMAVLQALSAPLVRANGIAATNDDSVPFPNGQTVTLGRVRVAFGIGAESRSDARKAILASAMA